MAWTLHPLQTSCVDAMVRRTDLLGGLFFLLTLYAVIRGATAAWARPWYVLATGCCLMGMASKEFVAAAPLLVLLYDRAFLGGSFREALRRRWGLYLGLAATWLLLVYLVLSAGTRGGTAGFGVGIGPGAYAVTQLWALTRYLRLSFWPRPLVFDYGTWLAPGLHAVWPQALLIGLLLAATGLALWRRPALGFLGAWFFLVQAPTSSVVPAATQTIAEHRMYLPLAAVVAGAVGGAYWLGARGRRPDLRRRSPGVLWLLPAAAIILATLGGMTYRRNLDYRTELAIWRDSVRHWPVSARGYDNYGNALDEAGQIEEGIVQHREALQLDPALIEAHLNLARDLESQHQMDEAMSLVREAVRINPKRAEARYHLGVLLEARGDAAGALAQYREAVKIEPGYAKAHGNLGAILQRRGELGEAFDQFVMAVGLDPDYPEAHYNLGTMLLLAGRTDAALAELREALALAKAAGQAELVKTIEEQLAACPVPRR
jgi:Flp pilus assembly protein TadD